MHALRTLDPSSQVVVVVLAVIVLITAVAIAMDAFVGLAERDDR